MHKPLSLIVKAACWDQNRDFDTPACCTVTIQARERPFR